MSKIKVKIQPYNEEIWARLTSLSGTNLFQSSAWGQLLLAQPNKSPGPVFIASRDDEVLGYCLSELHDLPVGQQYLYLNRGPVVITQDITVEIIMAILNQVAFYVRENKYLFWRVALAERFPYNENRDEDLADWLRRLLSLGGHRSSSQHQPEYTLILDISGSEEEILEQMKSKGRYNIKVAKKHEIKVVESDDVGAFYDLVQLTTRRNRFQGHDLAYYQAFLRELDDQAKLYLAYYEDKPVAGVIIAYEKNTAIYYYGASDNSYRKYMAPYLLHWQIIKDARKLGMTHYDLFGIAPPEKPDHPWRGITQFKTRFGGQIFQYVPTYDIPVKALKYHVLMTLNQYRKKLRP